MDPVKIAGVEIMVVAWDTTTGIKLTEEWIEVPPAVGPDNVEEFVFGRFGAPSVDDDVPDGWAFGVGRRTTELPGADRLIVVPHVRFPDGRRQGLFDYRDTLGRSFAELVADLDPTVSNVGPAPSETVRRLADEELTIVTSGDADLELQLTGWLRRLIVEGHTFLVVDLPATGRYVQFMTRRGDWLRAEAVGERYLGGHPPLTTAERSGLDQLGWNPPDEFDEDGGNHWSEWGDGDDDDEPHRSVVEAAERVADDDLIEAARMAARTLSRVFGPADPSLLVAEAGEVDAD